MLAHRQTNAALLLVTGQGQVGVKQIVGALYIACGVGSAHVHHHFGVGKAGHGAVGAAGQLFGQKQAAAVAREYGNTAQLLAVHGRLNGAELGQARAVFVLEHHAAWGVAHNVHDGASRHLHACGHGVVLQHPRHPMSARHRGQGFGHHVKVAQDLVVRAHARRRRHHHA